MTAHIKILILNWNGKHLLKPCLDSVTAIDYHNFSVMVIDNGSSDGSREMVKGNYRSVEMLALDHNYGFAGGYNRCFAQLKDEPLEFILLLNNDTEVDSEVTETFIHKDHDGYLVLNGNIKTTSNHPFYSDGNWIEAGNLSVGDKILHVDGLEHTIETIELSDESATVYNFEVEGTHNYFAEGYLVHNVGKTDEL